MTSKSKVMKHEENAPAYFPMGYRPPLPEDEVWREVIKLVPWGKKYLKHICHSKFTPEKTQMTLLTYGINNKPIMISVPVGIFEEILTVYYQ